MRRFLCAFAVASLLSSGANAAIFEYTFGLSGTYDLTKFDLEAPGGFGGAEGGAFFGTLTFTVDEALAPGYYQSSGDGEEFFSFGEAVTAQKYVFGHSAGSISGSAYLPGDLASAPKAFARTAATGSFYYSILSGRSDSLVANGVVSWASSREVAQRGGISFNYAAVPEPASWAMMISGFGLIGGALRRRPARSEAIA